jgi:hypothetical protein
MAHLVNIVGPRLDLGELSGRVDGSLAKKVSSLIFWKSAQPAPVIALPEEELLDQGQFQPALGIFHRTNVRIRGSHRGP